MDEGVVSAGEGIANTAFVYHNGTLMVSLDLALYSSAFLNGFNVRFVGSRGVFAAYAVVSI